MDNNRYKNYNNKIGVLPIITGAIALAPKIPAIQGAISAVTGFFGGIFGGGNAQQNKGYCEYSGNINCFQDGGNWLNDSGNLDDSFLEGGQNYISYSQNKWGGVLLQIFRAANRDYFDSRIKGAINAVLDDTTINQNGKKNFEVLSTAGNEAKQKFYNYISKYTPEFLPRFYKFFGQQQVQNQVQQPVSNGTLPQVIAPPQYNSTIQQPAKSNTLLYVGIGAAVLLGGFLILKKKR